MKGIGNQETWMGEWKMATVERELLCQLSPVPFVPIESFSLGQIGSKVVQAEIMKVTRKWAKPVQPLLASKRRTSSAALKKFPSLIGPADSR
jgi:hypothetical protein